MLSTVLRAVPLADLFGLILNAEFSLLISFDVETKRVPGGACRFDGDCRCTAGNGNWDLDVVTLSADIITVLGCCVGKE